MKAYEKPKDAGKPYTKGTFLIASSKGIEGKFNKTSLKDGEIYLVVACMNRWTRFVLTLGEKNVENIVSDAYPGLEGSEWQQDCLLSLIKMGSLTWTKDINIGMGKNLTAGSVFFKELKEPLKEKFLSEMNKFNSAVNFLVTQPKCETVKGDYFEVYENILKISERQYNTVQTS